MFDKLLSSIGGGSSKSCPWCGTSLIDGDTGGWGEGRFECPNCEGGVFFMEDGELVDSMTRAKSKGRARSCEMCRSSLSRGEHYLPYENGSNAHAYIICPSCKNKNIQYGFGEDD
jgi:hypothetical protein